MKRYITLLLCFFAFASFAVAQDDALNPELEKVQKKMQKMMQGMRKIEPVMMKEVFKVYADGTGTLLAMGQFQFQHGEEYLPLLGVSREKMDELDKFMREDMQEFMETRMATLAIQAAETDDEANLKKIGDEFVSVISVFVDKAKGKIEEVLTPEQITNIRRTHLQLGITDIHEGAEFPIVDFYVYSILDLSDEQKQKIADIRAKFEKEQFALFDKMVIQQQESNGATSPDEDAEITKKQEKLAEEGKQLVARTKTEIESVLTKSQLADWKKILTDLPPYVVKLRKANGLPIPDGADDSWKDSWKPGDPIPDNMRPAPRKGGFFPQAP